MSTLEDDMSTFFAKGKHAGHWGEKSESIPHHISKVGTGWTKCTPWIRSQHKQSVWTLRPGREAYRGTAETNQDEADGQNRWGINKKQEVESRMVNKKTNKQKPQNKRETLARNAN